MRELVEMRVRAAMERAAAVEFEAMRVDVASLASVASVAPWLGLLASVAGIIGSFRGVNGEKSAAMAALANSLSLAIWPTAVGLGVGVAALLAYHSLCRRLIQLRASAWMGAEEVLGLLLQPGVRWEYALDVASEEIVLWKKYQEKWNRWQVAVGLLTCVVAWGIQSIAYVTRDGYYAQWAILHASCDLGLAMVVAFAPAHVLWVRLLGGSAESRNVVIAALCLLTVVTVRLA